MDLLLELIVLSIGVGQLLFERSDLLLLVMNHIILHFFDALEVQDSLVFYLYLLIESVNFILLVFLPNDSCFFAD